MNDPDGMTADSSSTPPDPTPLHKDLPEVVVTAKKDKPSSSSMLFPLSGVPAPLLGIDLVVQEIPVVDVIADVISAGFIIYDLTKDQHISIAKHNKGDILPTPTKNPGDFTKLRGNQGYKNNKTGEIYKKSNTSHGNEGNTGEQWKIWPEGTPESEMGPSSKESGARTTIDQNGKVIGN